MYGMVVGEVTEPIPSGGLITTRNIRHRTGDYSAARKPAKIAAPDVSAWAGRTFMGYRRADGQVGTRNYWIVVPLVFCENRNVEQMREALEEELGYGRANNTYRSRVRSLLQKQAERARGHLQAASPNQPDPVFPNIDGIRFLTHTFGCGGTARTRRRFAPCSPATFTTPTLPAPPCSASAARWRSLLS